MLARSRPWKPGEKAICCLKLLSLEVICDIIIDNACRYTLCKKRRLQKNLSLTSHRKDGAPWNWKEDAGKLKMQSQI